MGGEARGDEARPEPRLLPRRREGKEVFVSRKDRVCREHHGASERPRAAAAGAGGERSDGGATEGHGAGWWRDGVVRRRGAGSKRTRSNRKFFRRKERLEARVARWGAGGSDPDGGDETGSESG